MSDDILTTTVPLTRRLTHDGKVYNSLTIREATVADQLDAITPGMGQAEGEIALVAHLASVPVAVITKVRLVDYRKVQTVVANFPYPPEEASTTTS